MKLWPNARAKFNQSINHYYSFFQHTVCYYVHLKRTLRAICTNINSESTSFRSRKLLIESVYMKHDIILKELKWDRSTF